MQGYGSIGAQPRAPPQGPPFASSPISAGAGGPPQLSTLPFQTSQTPPPQSFLPPQQSAPSNYSQPPTTGKTGNLPPPLKPVFGLSLEQLFERDGSAVPMVVYQCIQAVDLFGLEVEGIYRLSGVASSLNKIKAMFDNGKIQKHPQFSMLTICRCLKGGLS